MHFGRTVHLRSEADADEMPLSLTQEKLVIVAAMWVATFISGLVPVAMVTRGNATSRTLKNAISLSSCFAGGVFLAAGLLDLFPDVRESIDHVLDEIEAQYHTSVDYPVAEFIMVFGFLLVLIVEQIVLDVKEGFRINIFASSRSETTSEVSERRPLLASGDEGADGRAEQADHGTFHRTDSSTSAQSDTSSVLGGITDDAGRHRHSSRQSENEAEGHRHDHVIEHSTLRSFLLLLALCFHSVFEGLALGLQPDLGSLISIFIAVIAHKGVMAFSLGLTLAQSDFSRRSLLASLFVFSAASPVGMFLGIGLTDLKQSLARDVANGVLQGMAGGTFLYITFFEVLPHELNKPGDRMLKVLFVLIGYSCICGLLFLTH